jgi:hypothetical protein
MDAMNKLTAIDWAKIGTAAAVIGALLGTVLPVETVGSIEHWGGPIVTVLAGLAGAGTAFLVALRKK